MGASSEMIQREENGFFWEAVDEEEDMLGTLKASITISHSSININF
jgi:hypothetical protein